MKCQIEKVWSWYEGGLLTAVQCENYWGFQIALLPVRLLLTGILKPVFSVHNTSTHKTIQGSTWSGNCWVLKISNAETNALKWSNFHRISKMPFLQTQWKGIGLLAVSWKGLDWNKSQLDYFLLYNTEKSPGLHQWLSEDSPAGAFRAVTCCTQSHQP